MYSIFQTPPSSSLQFPQFPQFPSKFRTLSQTHHKFVNDNLTLVKSLQFHGELGEILPPVEEIEELEGGIVDFDGEFENPDEGSSVGDEVDEVIEEIEEEEEKESRFKLRNGKEDSMV